MNVRVPASITTEMVRTLAINESVCVRPVLRRVTDRATGATTTVAIPCGCTRESRCPSCAKKSRWLRMTQCTEGWHRDDEPEEADALDIDLEEDDPDDDEETVADDADEEQRRVRSTRRRQDVSDLPRVPVENRTVGRTFTAPSGVRYRPSMFVTLSCCPRSRVCDGGRPSPYSETIST